MHTVDTPAPASLVDRALTLARNRPGTIVAWVLGLHLVIWTVLPILVCPNLQLDLVEDLALGREWQLGYWKHPPLPWWLADLAYRLTGSINAVYLLGPLAAVACMYAVWRLAREVVPPLQALVAVLALEGIHFFNFSVVKFAHDQMQLPFWALTGWFVYRAIIGGRMHDWILSGAFLALAFWSKYAAFALAATIGLFLVIDPRARQAWRTAGPYLMALAFLIVLAPNLWWLVTHDFQPFRYVDERAVTAARWYQYVWFPLRWTGSQMVTLLPALLVLAAFVSVSRGQTPTPRFARTYVTALALGPFAVTTLVAAVLGRLPITMWGYPLWCFAPLAAVMWFSPVTDRRRLASGVLAFWLVFVAMPLTYLATEVLEPLVRDRPKATQFPGRLLAETVTRQWRERTGMPLVYVGGAEGIGTGPGEFAANNVAVYSVDRPHVIVHGNPAKSAWIDMADVARHGAVLVWLPALGATGLPDNLRTTFPGAELQPPLVLPRLTIRKRHPVTVHYAFWFPRG